MKPIPFHKFHYHSSFENKHNGCSESEKKISFVSLSFAWRWLDSAWRVVCEMFCFCWAQMFYQLPVRFVRRERIQDWRLKGRSTAALILGRSRRVAATSWAVLNPNSFPSACVGFTCAAAALYTKGFAKIFSFNRVSFP